MEQLEQPKNKKPTVGKVDLATLEQMLGQLQSNLAGDTLLAEMLESAIEFETQTGERAPWVR